MLVGQSTRTIDSKGRIILPRKFMRDFEDGLMMTKGLDDCVLLLPMEEWEREVSKLKQLPSESESTRGFKRVFFANAQHVLPDSQGRVLMPARLREMAEITKEVVVVGLADKAEVWAPGKWEKYEAENNSRYDQLAANIHDS